jgi:hypothetical protein
LEASALFVLFLSALAGDGGLLKCQDINKHFASL